MLSENIKAIRRSKGLSQQERSETECGTADHLEVGAGLSVPDSDLLIALSEALETPVSTLLGETVAEAEADQVKALSEKLEIINLQFARRKALRRSALHWLLIAVCGGILVAAAVLTVVNSPYLGWDYSAPETAVMGVVFHIFEWLFVRLAPIVLVAAIAGIFITRKKA
jgi:putative transcriptional regulator